MNYPSEKFYNDNLPFLSANKFNGLCFIGDPHFTDKGPQSRKDDFLNVLRFKMKFIAEYCNKNNLYPIILGDLIDKDKESSKKLWGNIIKSLCLFNEKPVVIVGNHDVKTKDFLENQESFNEKNEELQIEENYDIVFLLKDLDLVHLISSTEFIGRIHLKNKDVAIGGIPFGEKWEEDFIKIWFESKGFDLTHDDYMGALGADHTVLISHDNLPFEEANIPVIVDIKKIKGIDFVVNGHIHAPLKPINLKGMFIHNPGNIIRMAMGAGYGAGNIYEPSFATWNEDEPFNKLNRIILPHLKPEDIFNFETRHAGTIKSRKLSDAISERFTSELKNLSGTEKNINYIPDLAKIILDVTKILPDNVSYEILSLFKNSVDPDNVFKNVLSILEYYNVTDENNTQKIKDNNGEIVDFEDIF